MLLDKMLEKKRKNKNIMEGKTFYVWSGIGRDIHERLTRCCTRPIYPLRFHPLRFAPGMEAPRINGRVNTTLCAEKNEEKIGRELFCGKGVNINGYNLKK